MALVDAFGVMNLFQLNSGPLFIMKEPNLNDTEIQGDSTESCSSHLRCKMHGSSKLGDPRLHQHESKATTNTKGGDC